MQRCAAGGELYALRGRGEGPPSAAGGCRVPGWGKRGQDTRYGFLSPLDSPYLPLAATPFGCAAKRELRGLGSGRRGSYGWLCRPEVSLRELPRITVRGHTVQNVSPVAATVRYCSGRKKRAQTIICALLWVLNILLYSITRSRVSTSLRAGACGCSAG